MPNWIEFKDGYRPRPGEIIVVKGPGEPEILPDLLIVDEEGHFWSYTGKHGYDGAERGYRLGFKSKCCLTHWMLIESPY